ncbi:protein ANTAGONIST OF LIKE HETEROCHROMATIN PROTEIN 1-like [Alosa sapidissima]|uniref:protein ANTAGONIST OF LIKE HETEROCHROMATIN PROTEIN 1-like n=1 Tax=Alosa sapidissima TaxID=34773 RepID=UPI001C09B425|nr:protein ANTAGONIST OF LIKE HETEROCHROMATIN PROTEIN 1-like [Alosa sapidissima]
MEDYIPILLLLALQIHTGIRRRALTTLRDRYGQRIRSRRKIVLRLRATRRRTHAVWPYHPSQTWWDTVVPAFTPTQFIRNFRVSRESFEYICHKVRHLMVKMNTNYRMAVPVRKRVAIALWKLATAGTEYRTIGHLFGVGISTVFNCVQEFCDSAIRVLLSKHITTPDAAKLVEMATFFNNHWRMPQCVGAIDGNHIPIIAPEEYPRDYFNRKGWHSIILQGVVDGKGLFWDVCVGYAGSVHDARVLRQSHLWGQLSDEGLMKPFSDTGRLSPEQHTYNYRLSSARLAVEMAFGRLKGRWRCLLKRNDCKLELSKKMTLTCCVLHNICEEHGDRCIEDRRDRQLDIQPPNQVLPEHGEQEGADIRAALMNYFSIEE